MDRVEALSTDEDKTYSPTVKCELNGIKTKLDVDSIMFYCKFVR